MSNRSERVQAAVDAMAKHVEEEASEEASATQGNEEETQENQEEESPEGEGEGQEKVEGGEESQEAGGLPEDGPPPTNSEWRAYRRKERELKEREAALAKQVEEARAAERARLKDLAPQELLKELERDPDEEFASWTEERLGGDPSTAQLRREIKRLEAKLESRDKEPEEKPPADQPKFSQADIDDVIDMVANEAYKGNAVLQNAQTRKLYTVPIEKRWPNFARLPEMERADRVARLTAIAFSKAPNTPMTLILDKAEEMAQAIYNGASGNSSQGGKPDGKTREDSRSPGPESRNSESKRTSISNSDQSTPSARVKQRKPLTRGERVKRATQAIKSRKGG